MQRNSRLYYVIHKNRFNLIYLGLFLLLCIIIGTSYFLNKTLSEPLQLKCEVDAQQKFERLRQMLHDELITLQDPSEQFVKYVLLDPSVNFHDEDRLNTLLESVVLQNKEIYGTALGFEDIVFPEYADKKGYGLLVNKTDSGMHHQRIGVERDFRTDVVWYKNAREKDVSSWSVPFFAQDSALLAIYCIPFNNQNGERLGVFGSTLHLDHFTELVKTFVPYPSSMVAVIDEELNIISHPNRSYIAAKKMPDVMRRMGINPDIHPMDHAKTHETGRASDYMAGHKMFFYYGPIEGTTWTALLYCRADEIYSELYQTQNTFLIVTGCMIFVIALMLFITIVMNYKFKKRGMMFS